MTDQYIVAKNPNNHLWYACGYMGGYYMPISHGYKTRKEANKRAKAQYNIDKACRHELLNTAI